MSFCSLIKGTAAKRCMLCFNCPDKWRSFEPFMCLDPVLKQMLADILVSDYCMGTLISIINEQ